MTNFVQKVFQTTAKLDPVGKIADAVGVSRSNTLLDILQPHVKNAANTNAGAPTTIGNAMDPGRFVNKSPLDPAKDNAAFAASVASMPRAPNQDTAANAAQQQADSLRRRRGILGNIFGGQQPNTTPVVSSKQLLGQ